MQKIFLAVIDMSIVSSLVILAVLLVRAMLRRAPRRFAYVLWAAVLLRLLCPFAVESPLSLIPERAGEIAQSAALPESEKVTFASAASAAYRAIGDTANGGEDFVRVEVGASAPVVSDVQGAEHVEAGRQYVSASHGQVWLLLCAWLWPAGTAAVLVWGVAGQIRLRRMLVGAVRLEGEVWLADHIPTAFVMGLVRPRIYLPSGLDGAGRDYVLAHERAHIRRGDHVTRLLAFAALALHWFNPLVWLAFAMSGRDMEMSCDEAVMRRSGGDIRADYCQTLLDMSANRHFPSPCLLAFGESDTGARVRNALRWKKPAFWAVCGAGVLIAAACVLLLTNQAAVRGGTVEISFPAYQDGRRTGDGEQMFYDAAYDRTPFTMSVDLPKGWRAETPEELRVRTAGDCGELDADGCKLYTPVQLYDEKGRRAGFVGWSDFAPYEGDGADGEDYYKNVYYSLRQGEHYGWADYETVSSDEFTETHRATVYYQTPAEDVPAAAWPRHTASGVCHYDRRLNVYVAFQLDAGAATEKEISAIAESISLSASAGPADAEGSQTVKLSFPGHYVEGTKVLDSGPFVASVTLPEGWDIRGGWSLVPEGTDGEGYSPVYLCDAEGVTVGKVTYRIFDPDAPAQVYRAGSWSDLEYARIRYCNEIYRSGNWLDYETVSYSDTAETFRGTVSRSVQANDGTVRGWHTETETRYGIGRYDTELGVYVAIELRQARVSERDAAIIAENLALEPVSLTSASCYFGGWDYSDGERGFRRGKGDFIANMSLPEGWSAQIIEITEYPDIHELLGPVYNIYDENGSCVAWVAWAGFDPNAYTDDTVDRGLSVAVNRSLAERTDWAQRGWEQYFTNSYSGTAYIYEILDSDGVDTGRCGVCAYDRAKEVYAVVEFADGKTYDWAARIIAGSMRLQSVGSNSDRDYAIINSGYSMVNGVRVESKPYAAQFTLPEGWTLTKEVTPDSDMGTAGLEPWGYMFDAAGKYAGFIAAQSLSRPIQAEHYEWENIAQVASGDTDVYTADVIYDEFDESLLPGHPWRSFEAKGIRAESQDAGVYVVAQFVPEAISGEDFGEMARSVTFRQVLVQSIPGFAGEDWGTDRETIEKGLDDMLMGNGPCRRWSFLGHDCTAYYGYSPDGRLASGRYMFTDENTSGLEEAIELYKQLLAELEGMYGESHTLYLKDLTPMDIQSVIDGRSDISQNCWTKKSPDGDGVDIFLAIASGGVSVSYSLLYE